MPQKKQWSEREDQVLRYLFENQKMTKWSRIAQRMADQYKLTGRNGKQCRQRYQNTLDPSFEHHEWTVEEEQRMYKLHNEIGNKWAQIAQHMPGRTDNCVKNHMYSKLRKAIRKLNKTISREFKKEFKEIRQTVLYKIIEATDQNFKTDGTADRIMAKMSGNLKNSLLAFENQDEENESQHLPEIRQLSKDVHEFSKVYKRKPIKERRGHAQVKNLMKMPKIQKFKCPSDNDEDSDDLGDFQVSNQESFHMVEGDIKKQAPVQNKLIPKIKDVIEVSNMQSSFKLRKVDSANYEAQRQSLQLLQDSCQGVEMTLKQAGILEGGSMYISPFLKQSMSESNNSERNQQFNLGQSIEGVNPFKLSVILKHDGDLDEDNKLFRSMNE